MERGRPRREGHGDEKQLLQTRFKMRRPGQVGLGEPLNFPHCN